MLVPRLLFEERGEHRREGITGQIEILKMIDGL